MTNPSSILTQAIERLGALVNITAGALHAADESRIKELFVALHQRGIPLTYDAVYRLAIANHWRDGHAKSLAGLGERIGQGGRVQIKHPTGWGEKVAGELCDQ